MRKTLKKSFAVLLVIFMLVSVVPFTGIAATTTVSNESGLRSALAGAAAGDVIDVTSNISLTSSLTVSKQVTVKSSNGSSILRASSYASYMIVVANGGELTLEDITINGNRTSYQTADLATEMIVVQAGGTLNFNDGTVLTTNRGNAANSGGGITVAGTLNINGGTIANIHMHNSSNATVQYGAAVTVSGGTVNMYGGTIGGPQIDSANQNDGRNGAVGVVSGTFNMYGGAISGNVANQQGGGAGGVHISAAGTFNMYDGSVSNNNSRRNGGGFYNEGTLNISGGTISGNTATYTDTSGPTLFFGAGIYNTGTLTISGGEIINNVAKSCGGGVYNLGTMTMTGGKIAGNTSQTYSAGGIFVDGTGTLNISGGEISGNTAGQYGGAIAVTSSASNALVITNCIFGSNNCGANQCGSDIYITTSNTSNVRTTYDYECVHFQLYVDRVGARYSQSNAVAATSNVLTANYGYVYVASGEGHAWGEWTTVTYATCTTAGSRQRVCDNCGKVETETIAAFGHTWNNGVVTDQPGCTTTGTKVYTCTVCGATRNESVPALGHDDSGATRVEPTCTTAGSVSFTCPRCGQSFSETLPATGHTPVTTRVEPTCTVAGSSTTTCSVCHIVISSIPLPATGHTPGDWVIVTPATKTTTGLKAKYCTKCNTMVESEIIPVIPDPTVKVATVEVNSVPANSVRVPVTFIGNEGVWSMGFYVAYDDELTLKGVVNGNVFEELVDSSYEVNPATDTRAAAAFAAAGVPTSGVKCYRFYAENYLFENITTDGKLFDLVFNVPNTTEYELPITIVPVEGLTININANDVSLLKEDGAIILPFNNNCSHSSFRWEVTTPATCTVNGLRSKICNDCGRTLATEVIQAPGHTYGAWVETTPATCTAGGQETATCTVCGAATYRDTSALGHLYSEYVETTPATCTEPGTLTATCSRCHNEITDTIPALDHLEGEWVTLVEAHGAVDGIRVKYCTRCQIELRRETIPAPETPTLVGSTEEAEGNQTVDATITFNSNPGVYSMTLYVYYDEALTLNSVTNGVVFPTAELQASSNLRRDPSFRATCVSAFNNSGVDTAGKKVAPVLFIHGDPTENVTAEGVLLNLNFTTPDVLEGNYEFGVVYNAAEIYDKDTVQKTVALQSGEIQVRESVCDHVWSAWTTVDPATCTEAGSEQRTCSICGKVETNVIPATGHNVPNPTTVNPTCTEPGYTGGICSNCGQLISEPIPAQGHAWGEWTQIDDTHLQRECSRCGAIDSMEITLDPTLSVMGATVSEGAAFSIPVMITGNPGIYSLIAYVYFDSALHLDSVTNGEVFAAAELSTSTNLNRDPADSSFITGVFNTAGVSTTGIRTACLLFQCNTTVDNNGNGVLATLNFTAPDAEGTYPVGIVYVPADTYNAAETPVEFAVNGSEVIVSACNHVAGNVETVPATCTEDGYTRTYCSICGSVINEVVLSAKGHQPGEWEIVTPATTTTSGLKVKRCTVCQTILAEKTILPIGSPAISIGEVTAYAGENFTLPVTISNNPGLWSVHVYVAYAEDITLYDVIVDDNDSVLGEYDLSDFNENPATNSAFRQAFEMTGESTTGVKATGVMLWNSLLRNTTANGKLFDVEFEGLPVGTYRIYLVMRPDECFDVDEENVPMNLEDVIINVIERPTCEHANTTTVTVPATCTEAGYTRVTCDDCGTIISNVVIPPQGHDYVETGRVDATCEVDGTITETCSRCGDVRFVTIPAPGHDWSEWVNISATERQRTCSRCGLTQTEPIPTTPTLSVSNKTVDAGETFSVPVTIAGNPGIYSLIVYVYFDEALHLDSVTNGEVFDAAEFSTSSDLNRNPADSAFILGAFNEAGVDPTGLRTACLFFQGNTTVDNNGNGVLATLNFTAPAEAGTYAIGLVEIEDDTYNAAEEPVVFTVENAEITVEEAAQYLLGDVNGDGRVNRRDLTLLESYLRGDVAIDMLVFANTDINNDLRINRRDLDYLNRYLRGVLTYDDLLIAHGDL